MNKHKICVYAISKNEEKFVDRWVKSMSEADEIYVLDTGSTDSTIDKLRFHGVHVKKEIITPWRFDVARNKSLELIPSDFDICVCTDLDEEFEKGWRQKLENNWTDTASRARYNYNWSFDNNNKPVVNFYIEKIHTRNNYKWTHAVHEVLNYMKDDETKITIDEITLNHYPDSTKSRSSYLTLLELSVNEDPNDDRNMHYLGREYMYYGKWNECIDTLINHLQLPTAVWKDERCASMRFIARSYLHLKRYDEARMWLSRAINEAPYLRDPLLEMALLEFDLKNWLKVIKYCEKALMIDKCEKSYINEVFSWDETVYDLLSIAYFYSGNIDLSLKNIDLAISVNSSNERIIKNKEIILQNKKVK